ISDIIEQYLKEILQENYEKMIEIKRNEIADQFECILSLINYAINTRFIVEKEYLIESKRGGCGYIRIIRIENHDSSDLIDDIIHLINPKVSQQAAIDVVKRLYETKIINRREEYLMVSVMDREVLAYPLPDRDILRARILTAMLTAIKYAKK